MSGAADGHLRNRFGRFQILMQERQLLVDSHRVALGSRAFDLLAALVGRRDRVVPKDELIEVVWPGLVVEENNLQVQISALRKVLGAQAIATVPGRGYRFVVAAAESLEAVASTPPGQTESASRRHEAGAARPSRLLVADDNKVNRLLLCRSLELMGHEVESAVNGREALEKLRAERFDLLLLDLEMPELDGFGLLERRAADPLLREVPVIVTSALEGAAHVARCIELGAEDYLHKPPNPMLLKARVDSSLERKHLRDRERELLARLAPAYPPSARADARSAAGRRVDATLMVAHLGDAQALEPTPAETLELLSNWSTLMLDAIEGHGGLVTQLSGDTLGAAFGTAGSQPLGDTVWAAVQASLEMTELVAQFNRERAARGLATLVLSIGIASGETIVGEGGTRRRGAYVCVGAASQRAVRLQALAAQAFQVVLLDGPTRVALPTQVSTVTVPAAVLPGCGAAVPIHALKIP